MANVKLMTIEDLSRKTPAPKLAGLPVLRLGFRPLYLLAAAFAAVSVPLWLLNFVGKVPLAQVNLLWHMHEMVFGFILAVIVGFLFTAARNWTGLWTPRGPALAAIAALWIAGRAGMLLCPPLPAALLDLLFIPAAIFPLYRVLHLSGNKRNLPLLGLLGLMGVANAAYHGAMLGWVGMPPLTAIHAAILVIVVMATVMGGRLLPGFTANTIAGSKPVQNARLDKAGIALVAAAGLAWVAGAPAALSALLAFGAAALHLARLSGWAPLRTGGHPLLWILHVGYAWIAVGFVLLGLAALGLASASSAFHALAAGALASLILGMITRTALGHTGRLLRAGRKETAMYLLLQAGAASRLAANAVPIAHRDALLLVSGACWSAAFLLYVIVYGPYLCSSRIDGREG